MRIVQFDKTRVEMFEVGAIRLEKEFEIILFWTTRNMIRTLFVEGARHFFQYFINVSLADRGSSRDHGPH